jgi:hypothetical protein
MLIEPLIQQLHQLRLTPLRQSDRSYALADPSFLDAGILPPKGARHRRGHGQLRSLPVHGQRHLSGPILPEIYRNYRERSRHPLRSEGGVRVDLVDRIEPRPHAPS